eukprot:CAMPEP_0198422006 /NCGR_PEP_ID=MMETSP1452-20131203/2045_1 /TAXON_ID=1181717 /ORGANISM="Synchroma pusillum, Strain CCMP3072" /LENGTH=361 /DNA_ID=CAMNT_0044142253 /DNA_START=45 /DNA_END=1130 /DNA_ORIENTATION=+
MSRKSSGSPLGYCALVVAILAAAPMLRMVQLGHDLRWALPNALLLLPLDSTARATRQLWHAMLEFDTAYRVAPKPVAEVMAEDYSPEVLRRATNNWREPAVVRGLFKGTRGVERWAEPGYLPQYLGHFTVPVVMNATVGVKQDQRAAMTFGEAFDSIVSGQSSRYLFFPVQSREHFDETKHSTGELAEAVNDVVRRDLDLDRIWKGFSGPTHERFLGSQLIAGFGRGPTARNTTGTGWHCAAGNNWFIMVAGRKRWYFADPVDSPYMFPMRGGIVNMRAGTMDMGVWQNHMPTRYTDLEPGDMLYNPDWEWHTISNYEGVTIGVPIREFNASLSVRNNPLFTGVVLLNKALVALGAPVGGF